jgi:hypothetical protein
VAHFGAIWRTLTPSVSLLVALLTPPTRWTLATRSSSSGGRSCPSHEGGVRREEHVARRGTRAEQYFAVAAYYGEGLAESLRNPSIPEFVLVQAARRAAHYALTALSLQEKRARQEPSPAVPAGPSRPRQEAAVL